MTRIRGGIPDRTDEKARIHQGENLLAILIGSMGLYNFLEERGSHFGIGDGSIVSGRTLVMIKSHDIGVGLSQQNFFQLILWASNRRFEHLHNRGHVALPVGKVDGFMLKGKGVLEETDDDVGAQPVSSLE